MQSEWVMSSPSSQEAVYDKDPVCLVWRSLLISRRLLSVVSGECSRRPLLSLSFCSGSQPRSLQQIHHLIQLLSSQVVVVPGADDDQRKHEEEEEAGHDWREGGAGRQPGQDWQEAGAAHLVIPTLYQRENQGAFSFAPLNHSHYLIIET